MSSKFSRAVINAGKCAARPVALTNAVVSGTRTRHALAVVASAAANARMFSAAAADEPYLALDESKHNLDDIIAKETCILYYTASWCGPCRMIGPVFSRLAKEHGQSIKFIKIDVDDNGSTADAAQIKAVPTFRAYKAGKMVQEFSGANESALQGAVTALSK